MFLIYANEATHNSQTTRVSKARQIRLEHSLLLVRPHAFQRPGAYTTISVYFNQVGSYAAWFKVI